ncbi:hypothetical protein J437_LFUL003268 [Ladona fulva]|uniref:Peptidase S1 domain-containing protein n=1 Tax=Ladona fulva TaxID=123851 RepID=A0A8K0JT88_LADFU|nr:hypothetical protein J437_LFUL003268 [Ladona fulva]
MTLKVVLLVNIVLGCAQAVISGILRTDRESNQFPGPDPYLVGGEIVTDRFFPSVVSLQINKRHVCGGVILQEDAILTAASCIQGDYASSIQVVEGSNQLDVGGTEHKGHEKFPHPGYDIEKSWKNNIAILKLETPIKFRWGVVPVKLPEAGAEIEPGTTASAVGWGSQAAGENATNDLYKVDLPIVDLNVCNETYHPYSLNVFDNEICAGGVEGEGTCDGDTGGPLFIDNEIVGIASWGKPCAEESFPTVFMKVSHYVDWIQETLDSH